MLFGDDDELEIEAGEGGPRRHFYVYTDESGFHGTRYYGFGTLWLPYERRGDFQEMISALRREHRYRDEIKWSSIRHANRAFYIALVNQFFRRRWLMFHALVVRQGYVKMSLHGGSRHVAHQKHFCALLSMKLRRFASPDKVYRLRVDPLPSPYAKADEAALIITNHTVQKKLGLRPVDSIRTCDSRRTAGIQLCDVLTGAVLDAWNAEAQTPAKHAVRDEIAACLGWETLRHDTYPDEWKFNVCYFRSGGGQREAESLDVDLRYPMPSYARVRRQPAQKAAAGR